MKIEHVAIWVGDLEKMRSFYETYFAGTSGELYHNQKKSFKSYFISFEDGCRLELMNNPSLPSGNKHALEQYQGLVHFAISVGSPEKVDSLTNRLRNDGYRIIGEPRITGDGYYESVVLDPEDNRIEITI